MINVKREICNASEKYIAYTVYNEVLNKKVNTLCKCTVQHVRIHAYTIHMYNVHCTFS